MAEDDIDGDGEPDGLYERPLDIITYKTAVVITGPGVMNLAMTAEAAEQTAALLLEAAKRAQKTGDAAANSNQAT